MKEFIEKLIGRLEECTSIEDYGEIFISLDEIYEIVNQLAEEYKDKAIINEQYCWQTCGATEHCKECNRLCNGSIDYYENYDVLAEEHKDDIHTIDVSELLGEQVNDFCEWKSEKDMFIQNPHTSRKFSNEPSMKNVYCNTCGKKIKVAPYQPKGE